MKTYRFTEVKDGNAKDYLYYRRDKYSPKEIYEIVNGKDIMSYQITTHKERVKNEIYENYIRYSYLAEAIEYSMPNNLEYKVTWLHQKLQKYYKNITKILNFAKICTI